MKKNEMKESLTSIEDLAVEVISPETHSMPIYVINFD